jgi:hypothetical protein
VGAYFLNPHGVRSLTETLLKAISSSLDIAVFLISVSFEKDKFTFMPDDEKKSTFSLARQELIKANKKTITKLICLVLELKIIYKKSK